MRSKFDDEESHDDQYSHSEGEYMPLSPTLSDPELKPEDMLPPYLPAIKVKFYLIHELQSFY